MYGFVISKKKKKTIDHFKLKNISFISFLPTDDSFKTLAGRFCVGVSTVQRAVKKICIRNIYEATKQTRLGEN